MKKFEMASFTCLLLFASVAQGQCSSWENTINIAATLGDPGAIVGAVLSNDSEFLFIANSCDGTAGFLVDGSGQLETAPWEEGEDGSATLSDCNGNVCTILCDSEGGIVVTIAGDGTFATLRLVVMSSGAPGPTDKCLCDGAMFGPHIRDCDQNACDLLLPCRGTVRFPTANCAWVRVIGS